MKKVISLVDRRQKREADCSAANRFLSASPRRPLSIRIDSANIAQLSDIEQDPVSTILLELAIWRRTLGNRGVSNIELRYQADTLPDHAITRLIHGVANEFNLRSSESRVKFEHDEQQSSPIALLKGLGFSHCQFEIGDIQDANFEVLKLKTQTARSYRFQKVGIQIAHADDVQALTDGLKRIKAEIKPDYVFVGTSTYKLPTIETSDRFTLFEEDLINDNLDHLALGPCARTDIQGREFDNLSDVSRYCVALKQQVLPLIQLADHDLNQSHRI
jgi:hypothetical protein